MKISLKTPAQIQLIREGGQKLSQILETVVKKDVKVGERLEEIEKAMWAAIVKAGGKPAFAQVPGYHWATCINVNEGVVHGIPLGYQIKPGDVVTVDTGMVYRGWHSDMSTTFLVPGDFRKAVSLENGEAVSAEEIRLFLETGKQALKRAIAAAQPGQRIGHISAAIQGVVEGAGYSCLRNLTGHGIGRNLHEPPPIPCFLRGDFKETPLIKPGMVLAVEVIYAMGSHETETGKDGWTIRMKDGKISAVFEKTIAIADDGPFVCT